MPVSDIGGAYEWYGRLFGRTADNRPMESLVEWRVTETGWLQVTDDAGQPGTGVVNFAVDELAGYVAGLTSRGIEVGPIRTVNKGVRLCAVTDPDGNTITFIGNFRIDY